MLDYLIIGQGLAGSILARHFSLNGNSFKVIDHNEQSASSRVAAGVFNPVTGKRVVKTWLADTIFPFAKDFYTRLDKDLGINSYCPKAIYRPFQSVAEQNDVLAKSTDERIAKYISPISESTEHKGKVEQELGGIDIHHGGYVDLPALLDSFRSWLSDNNLLIDDDFKEENLVIEDEHVSYRGLEAKTVILCQGHQATQNTYFDWLPWSLTKGEILELKIEDFPSSKIINKGGFVLPHKNGDFIVGASYERKIDKNISQKGRNIVLEKINKIFSHHFEIIGQRVGIRPTVRDRRPFLGRHPKWKNVVIFNGLGTKGVTLGPYFGHVLIEHLENKKALPKEVDINRYIDHFAPKTA